MMHGTMSLKNNYKLFRFRCVAFLYGVHFGNNFWTLCNVY